MSNSRQDCCWQNLVEKNSFSLQPVVVLERLPDEVLKWHIESYKYSKWASAELVRDETCYPSWSRYVAKKKSTKSDQSTIPPDKDQSSVVVGSFKLTSLKEGAEEQTLFRTTSMSKNNVRCSKCGALFLKTKSNAMCLNCRPKALAMEKIKKQWKQMSINSCNLPKQRAHMIINQKSEATNLQTSATRIELIKYLKKRKLSEEKHYSDDDKCGFKSLESNVAKRLRDWDSSFAHTNNLTSVNKQNSQTISEDSSGEIFKNFGISPVKRSNGCLHNIKPYILENHSWARDQEGNGTKKCPFFVDEIKETVLKKEGTSTNFQNEKKKMENLDNKSRKEKKDDFCMQALRRTDTDERLKINSSDIQPKHSPSQQKGIRTNKVEWKKHQNDPYSENLNTKKDSLINEEVSYTDDNDCVNSKVNPNSKKVMDADCPQGNQMEVCLQSDNNVKIETQQDKRQSLESFSCKETLSNQNEDAKLNVKIKENNTDEECKSTTKVILNVDRNKITFKQVVGSYKKRGVEIKDVRNGLLLMTFDDDEDIISETEEPLVESHLPKNGICDNFQEGNRNMHSYNDNLQYMEDNEHLKKKHSFLEAEQNTSNQSVNQITKVQLEETQKLQYNQKQKNLKLELEKAQIVGNSTASAPEIKDNHGCLQQISHVRSQKSTSDLKEPKVTQHVTLHDETDEQYGKSSAYSEVMSQLEGAESILGHEMLVPVVQNVNLKKEKSKTLKEEIVNFWKEGLAVISPLDELDCLAVASIVDLDCGPEKAMDLFRFKLKQNIALLRKLAIAEQYLDIPPEVVKKNKNMILSAITKLLFSVRLVKLSKDDSQSTHEESVQSNLSCNSHYSDHCMKTIGKAAHVSVATQVPSVTDINSQSSNNESIQSLGDQKHNQELEEFSQECLRFKSARKLDNLPKKESVEHDFVPLSSSAHQTSSLNSEQMLTNTGIMPIDKNKLAELLENSSKQQLYHHALSHLSSGQNSFGTLVSEVSEKCFTNGQASSQTNTLIKRTSECPQSVNHSNIKLGQQLHYTNVAPELTPSSKISGSKSILRKQSDETVSNLAQGELCSKQLIEMSAQRKQEIETNMMQGVKLNESHLVQQFSKSMQRPQQAAVPSELSHQHSALSKNSHINQSLTFGAQLQHLGIETPNTNIIQQLRLNSSSCNQQHMMFSNQQHYKDSTSTTCDKLTSERVFSQQQYQQVADLIFTQGHNSKITSDEPSNVGSNQIYQQLSYIKTGNESPCVQEPIKTSTQQHWDKKTELSQQERPIKSALNQVSATSVPSHSLTLLPKYYPNISTSTNSPVLDQKQMLLPTMRMVPNEIIPSYTNIRPMLQVPNKSFYQRTLSHSRNSVSPESERNSVSSCTSGDTCNSPALESDLQSKQPIDHLNPTLVSAMSCNIDHWTNNIGQQSVPESLTCDLQLERMNMPLYPPYSLQQNFPKVTSVICTPNNRSLSKNSTYHQVENSKRAVPRSGLVPCATRVPMSNVTSPSIRNFMIHSKIKESSLLALSQCTLCGKQARNVCSACSKVSYCGEACAKTYWAMKHFRECEHLQN